MFLLRQTCKPSQTIFLFFVFPDIGRLVYYNVIQQTLPYEQSVFTSPYFLYPKPVSILVTSGGL